MTSIDTQRLHQPVGSRSTQPNAITPTMRDPRDRAPFHIDIAPRFRMRGWLRTFSPRLLSLSAALLLSFGCASAVKHRRADHRFGVTYYLDGAGGGNTLSPWAGGVRKGLDLAGADGEFKLFRWNTGLGVPIDQAASVEYKRQKARKLAAEIRTYKHGHPNSPVNLVALSAGTAVAVFALEELAPEHSVNHVVLLGSSLSAHYDLSRALESVRGRFVVFTSPRDTVLSLLVPLAGTADREYCGACAAGLKGFHVPPGKAGDPRAIAAYNRVEQVDWREEFASAGNNGGHTDTVKPRFVSAYVAPILLVGGPIDRVASSAPGDSNPGRPPILASETGWRGQETRSTRQ